MGPPFGTLQYPLVRRVIPEPGISTRDGSPSHNRRGELRLGVGVWRQRAEQLNEGLVRLAAHHPSVPDEGGGVVTRPFPMSARLPGER